MISYLVSKKMAKINSKQFSIKLRINSVLFFELEINGEVEIDILLEGGGGDFMDDLFLLLPIFFRFS